MDIDIDLNIKTLDSDLTQKFERNPDRNSKRSNIDFTILEPLIAILNKTFGDTVFNVVEKANMTKCIVT